MLRVNNLSFSYTKKPFIENMNFDVDKGEIFGFLGPSGAGKSTLQKILKGLVASYTGSVRLGGVECRKHDNTFYENIDVDFEYLTLYEKLSARQNLEFFASLYNKKPKNINELFAEIGLQNDAEKKVSDYSKGMKSRLNFLKALIHDPEIIFLDEPTSGLDPSNSRLMKDMIM
jgi:fluoroquinolone transport system ATP-binding protein